MCGIAGYFLNTPIKNSPRYIDQLLNYIRQRGPDDEGVCLIDRQKKSSQFYKTDLTVPSLGSQLPYLKDKESIINHDLSFIHTRYAIIDLTEAAHQPFVSGDNSVVGVFNGEIYNYIELKDELSSIGVNFRTTSDTEVLIEGYRIWGDKLWAKMNGFWAVVLYDFRNNTIVLSRDRIGVAPLYYREMPDGFFFASSIQPLIDIDPEGIDLNNDVVLGFAQTGIKDHDNTTFYSQIKSVPASSTVVFHFGQYTISKVKSKKYWGFPKSRLNISDYSFQEAVKQFRETFFNAVEIRLRADVKVAFELSGGLDSSSVVAAAALQRNNDITTYTIKVPEANEEPYARAILEYYPIDYHVLNKLEETFIDNCDPFSKIMEEPYHSPNIYTHYRMRQNIKREGVSVVVMGAGGDETLAGYESSFWPKAYSELKNNGLFMLADWYEFRRRFMTFHQAMETFRHYLFDLPKYFRNRSGIKRKLRKELTRTRALVYQQKYGELSFQEQTLYHFKVALIPYYMRSNDHFTMAIPLEHRFPFLDYRMVELGLQMPISYLFRNGWTKYILRKAMEPYLPKKIVWRRKKMGFPFPYHRFLSSHRSIFEILLKNLSTIDFPTNEFVNYEQLLKTDPVLLWRLVSTAIWTRHNLQKS